MWIKFNQTILGNYFWWKITSYFITLSLIVDMQKLFSTTYGPREGLIKRGIMDSKSSVISTSDTFRSFNYASKNHLVYLKLLESLCIPWKCILLLNRSRIQIQYQFSFTTIIAQISSQPFYHLFFHVSSMIRLTRIVTLMESILDEI